MGKLEFVGGKEVAGRLRAEWKLAEGDAYDSTYPDEFLNADRGVLPAGFVRNNLQTMQNCPDALVEVRIILDPKEDKSTSPPKDIPCEDHKEQTK